MLTMFNFLIPNVVLKGNESFPVTIRDLTLPLSFVSSIEQCVKWIADE